MSEPGHDPDGLHGRDAGRTKGWHRRFGFAIGVLLLGGAAGYLLSDPGTLGEFFAQIRHAPRWATIIVLVGPIFNWLFVGMCLHALMRRHGLVGRREMLALVGSAWLLNHLPMRPGLVGRIGYHAKVNKIRVRDSIEASVWSLVMAAIANAVTIGLVFALPHGLSLARVVLVLLVPQGVYVVLALVAAFKSANLGGLMQGLAYRNADLLIWMIRYAAAFAMLGIELTPIQIALITAVSQAAQVIPLTGGGFGFREWGVGIVAKMASTSVSLTMRIAIMADVINRIAETIIVIPLGLVCTGLVARWFTQRDRSAEEQPARHPEQEDQPGEPG